MFNKRFNDTEFQVIHPDSRQYIYVVPAIVAREELEKVTNERAALTNSDLSIIENALSNLAIQCEKDAAELAADDKANRATTHLQGMLRESAAKYRATLAKIQGGE